MRHLGHPPGTPACRLRLAAILSLFGCVCFWKGVWNLLELYLLPPGAASEVLCIAAGLACLVASRGLVNAGGVLDATTLLVTL
jgi:hypothetical protein